MLSREIYDSWNARSEADLQDLLENISGPHLPNNVRSTSFKKSVLLQIERRKAADKIRITIDEEEPEEKPCCTCLSWLTREKGLPKACDCRSMGAFESICGASTSGFFKVITLVKALIQKLSYWESIKPGTDGLSVIGGYMWLLSFSCQHLIDCPNAKNAFMMQTHVVDIKEKYQELGQAGELFLDLTESFHQNTHKMRSDALTVLKRLTKRWKFTEDRNPLCVRPEAIRSIPRPRRRLGTGLDSPFDVDDEDDVFSVKWSPLTVFVQLPNATAPQMFGRLHPEDRLAIFRKFLQCALDRVEMAAEDLTVINTQIEEMEMGNSEKHGGRQITLAMVNFSKSRSVPLSLAEGDMQRIIVLLNEFWYSLDVLHENVYMLLRLVQETRDIIRTCYVYSDIFYKWYMPSYDTFMSKHKKFVGRSGWPGSKEFLNKLGNSKNLSDTLNIVSLMDFSSSIYQGVVQEIPIQCEGMTLRLGLNEVEMEEPLGLVSGIVDKRKSTIR